MNRLGRSRVAARLGDADDPVRRARGVPDVRRRDRHARRQPDRRPARRTPRQYITDTVELRQRHVRHEHRPAATSSTSSTIRTGAIQKFIQDQQDDALQALRRRPRRHLAGALGAAVHLLPRRRRTAAAASDLQPTARRTARSACSRTWELAITKTGGYLYSRALLAGLSAIFHWIVFQALGTQAPVALAAVGRHRQPVPARRRHVHRGRAAGASDVPRLAARRR